QISGQLSHRLFKKLPPRVCVSLKTIVNDEFLRAGNVEVSPQFNFFLFFLNTFSFHPFKEVRHVRLFTGEEIYSDLYLTVCEWPSDHSKIIIFGFNTRSSSSMLMNMMMSDENNRDIYITVVTMPPFQSCKVCNELAATTRPGGSAQCLQHGFMLNTKYQVVYPFPTFQPAFQLKRDQVVLLNTSYSLVACAVSVHAAGECESDQVLYCRKDPPHSGLPDAMPASSSSSVLGSPCSLHDQKPPLPSCEDPSKPRPSTSCPDQSLAASKAREFAADIFRMAQGRAAGEEKREERGGASSTTCVSTGQVEEAFQCDTASVSASSSSSPLQQGGPGADAGYVNYTKLRYCLQPQGGGEQETEYEDEKILLPFTMTDLKGRSLQALRGEVQSQYVMVEQLTLDFEYVINEVIRNDAAWSKQFCSFSDYDIVILESNSYFLGIRHLTNFTVLKSKSSKPRYNRVLTNINNNGAAALAPSSGSVWTSYRKSCVNTVMKWLVPENSTRYINRMTNEALHKG
ncbi:DCA15 factor, partial [Polyodon spathula]|nr:DCA15 factor [Polyodon spathula]